MSKPRICFDCGCLREPSGACSMNCPGNEFDEENYCTECGELYEDCECEDLEEEIEEEKE